MMWRTAVVIYIYFGLDSREREPFFKFVAISSASQMIVTVN